MKTDVMLVFGQPFLGLLIFYASFFVCMHLMLPCPYFKLKSVHALPVVKLLSYIIKDRLEIVLLACSFSHLQI